MPSGPPTAMARAARYTMGAAAAAIAADILALLALRQWLGAALVAGAAAILVANARFLYWCGRARRPPAGDG